MLLGLLTSSQQSAGLDVAQTIILEVQHESRGAIHYRWKAGQRHIEAEHIPQVSHSFGTGAQWVEHTGWVLQHVSDSTNQ